MLNAFVQLPKWGEEKEKKLSGFNSFSNTAQYSRKAAWRSYTGEADGRGKKPTEVAYPMEKNTWSIFQISHKKSLVFYPCCKQMLHILLSPPGTPGQLAGSTFCLISCSESSKESACNAGNTDLIPMLGISLGEGNGNPLQYCCLGNPMDRGAR